MITSQRVFKLFLLIIAILVADVCTKYLVHEHVSQTMWSLPMYPYGGIPVFHDFFGIDLSINHVTNRGGPWGVVSSHHTSLLMLRLFAIVCLSLHLLFFNQVKFREIPLSMVIAGAVGNVLDSFFYGHVIDMIHCVFWGYSFPVFNLADASISIGVAIMLIHACVMKWKGTGKPQNRHQEMFDDKPFSPEESFSLDKLNHHDP